MVEKKGWGKGRQDGYLSSMLYLTKNAGKPYYRA